jgi:YspA, cpYpsA-related SLOG family
VLVCGSRSWRDEGPIRRRLEALQRQHGGRLTVVQGGAAGVDRLAEAVAVSLDIAVERYPADWARWGAAAGPMRNRAMLATGIDLVIAWWDGRSPGTAHMMSVAEAARVPVERHQAAP